MIMPCPSWLVWWYGAVDRDALLLTETGEVWWYDIPPPHAYPMRWPIEDHAAITGIPGYRRRSP